MPGTEPGAISGGAPEAPRRVRIFDTTLRDGEQAPGCTMQLREKLAVAEQLARLGVDVIEAGFPAASEGEHDAVQEIARRIGGADGPVICGLARTTRGDIERCASAIAPAARRRIHTFCATSDIHLEYKLRMTREQVLARVADAVAYARSLADDVEFSAEDGSRSDPEFLCAVMRVAVRAGATTLNVPDTVGYTTPDEYGELIARVCAIAAETPGVVVSAHCHDDLGLAVANSLAAVRAGAGQVECTVNGIGERAGNASLEEIVMALHTRGERFGAFTGIETTELSRASRIVSESTGVYMPPNKAIVGANAFAHESGIHQDGVLKYRQTYEIMSPESVGADGSALVLGKHSGRAAVRTRLQHLGFELDDEHFLSVFQHFKEVADRKKVMDDRDLIALVTGEEGRNHHAYELVQVQVASGTHAIIPTATVRVRTPEGEIRTASATGTGPVDAACSAVNAVVGDVGQLSEFTVRAVTEGLGATGEVTVRIMDFYTGKRFVGRGAHTDIVAASAEAYLDAVNRLFESRGRTQAALPESARVAAEVA